MNLNLHTYERTIKFNFIFLDGGHFFSFAKHFQPINGM